MTTIYVNAPLEKSEAEGKKSYHETLTTAIGDRYAIPERDAEKCLPGSKVVLLCQDGKHRAEGRLKGLVETGEKTGSGIIRYDVHMEDLVEVYYSPPPSNLRRTGILVVA